MIGVKFVSCMNDMYEIVIEGTNVSIHNERVADTANVQFQFRLLSLKIDTVYKTFYCMNTWDCTTLSKIERIYRGCFTAFKVNAYH